MTTFDNIEIDTEALDEATKVLRKHNIYADTEVILNAARMAATYDQPTFLHFIMSYADENTQFR
jgi:hypothetical protein